MILDSRIKEGKRPLTCLDVEQAREFVGKQCLFSDSYVNFNNIREYAKYPQYTGILHVEEDTKCLRTKEDYVFRNGTDGYLYSLCLPLEWVKEEKTTKFEPYTLDTWEQEFKTGDVVFFKGKEGTFKDGTLYKCIYLGYLETEDNRILVILGPWLFGFSELLNLYEIDRSGNWEPFGRKVETIDLNVI